MPPRRRDQVFPPHVMARLRELGEAIVPDGETAALAAALPDLLPTADACVTGWGAPLLRDDLLDRAPRLRIIVHAASTIRHIIPIGAFDRGITVCHSADVIAESVCEYVIYAVLTGLRRLHTLDAAMRSGGGWDDVIDIYPGHLLRGKTVGLIGCGYVAQRVIALLRAFGVRIVVFDPYLPAARAAELGVESLPLDRVIAEADILSNHAPITPETRHMVRARELALLKDGAILINSARAWAIDQDALLDEIRSGRIWAVLDVFEPEPLPDDSPLRALPNVFLTPHRAGHTVETLARQGQEAVEEVARFFAGEPVRRRVARESYPIMG